MAAGPKKLILIAATAGGLAALALVSVLVTDFDSPELGRLALGQVGKASGFDLQARSFRLNLLRGLELEGVEARATGGGLQASVDKIMLKHRPAALLGGTLEVTEVVIAGPRVELESGGAPAADPPAGDAPDGEPPVPAAEPDPGGAAQDAAGSESTSLDLEVSTIRLEDGSLVQRVAAGDKIETTEIRGLEVEMRDLKLGSQATDGEPAKGGGRIRVAELELSDGVETTLIRGVEIDLDQLALDRGLSLAGTSLTGEARFAEVVTGDGQESATQAEEVSGRLELESGRFYLRELELTTPQGVLRGALEADVAAEPLTYSLDLRGDPLSTGVLLGLGDLRGLGTSVFELKASGEGSDPARIAGAGKLTVGGGELPEHPVLAQVEQLLGNVVLIGAGYETLPIEFDIRSHRIHVAPCELRAGPVSLTLSGWVDFEGPLEMELSVLAPREGLRIEEIPKEVLEVLAEDDGRINLPMLMTGTADGSTVTLNRDYLAELGKRYVRQRAEQEIGKALGRLFGDN